MSDYISRDAALTALQDPELFNVSPRFLQILRVLPAADVEPVRHGRWVNMGGFPACSECACSPAVWEPKPNNPKGFPEWCYGCGAKMDLEGENANAS